VRDRPASDLAAISLGIGSPSIDRDSWSDAFGDVALGEAYAVTPPPVAFGGDELQESAVHFVGVRSMLCGPPSTGTSVQSAISVGSRAAVDSNGRIRSSVP
jgi:hypothetical protein